MKKKLLIVFLICCMMFGVTSPAFAYNVADIDINTLPAPPDTYGSYYIFENWGNSSIEAKVLEIQPYITLVSNEYRLYSPVGGSFSSATYVWRDDGDGFYWAYQKRYTNHYQSCGPLPPLGANFNLLDENGEPFFPRAPLVEETVELMNQTAELIPAVAGNLQILVPFGIICLALLVGLVLLRKIFRIFPG